MTLRLTLYRRTDCCLSEEMKEVIRDASKEISFEVEEIDLAESPDIREKYGNEVPVLFVNGRQAFKCRVTVKELKKKLGILVTPIWTSGYKGVSFACDSFL